MKKVSHRTLAVLVMALLVLAGLTLFLLQYFREAGDWVTFPGSPHVYVGSNLSTGAVRDRSGTLLLETEDGTRRYASDETVRKATLHLLGDRYGYIPSPVLNEYADVMAGFDPVHGVYQAEAGTMTLTLSAAANTTALEALAGRHGCVVVYNYRSGEVLCMVSAPSYDPDHMPDVEGDSSGQYDGVYVNRVAAAAYTPGSIFKLVTAVAAHETLPDLDSRQFSCSSVTELGGEEVHCLNWHGTLSFREALAKSCNVVFGELAAELGAERLTEYARKLGICSSLTVDGLHTAPGSFDLSGAGEWELAWAGIGQYTDLINPMQYLTLIGAIAAEGRAAQPYLVASVEPGYRAQTELLPRALSKETADWLAELMVNDVESVYGAWNFPDVTVGAKSGTAEQAGNALPNATFAGFVQDEDYPLAFLTVVENAGAGSEVCIPIVSAVLTACMEAMDET